MTEISYDSLIQEWIELVLASAPNAVIMIIPTFMDQCFPKEVKMKCYHILQMVERTRIDITAKRQKKPLQYRKGSIRQNALDLPFLPTRFMLYDEESEEVKVWFQKH